MAEVVVAREAGACFGVERALEMVREAARASEGRVYTLGPLIHNPVVISELAELGVQVTEDISEVPVGSTLVLRTHGVTPDVEESAHAAGLEVLDATCPFVKRAHRAAARLAQEGYQVLVVGEHGHAEAEGTCGHAAGAQVVASAAEACALEHMRKAGVVVQTTMSTKTLREVMGELVERAGELRLINTICDATAGHQDACAELAREVDVVVVVGGKNSANTRHLVEVACRHCANVHHIERPEELEAAWFAQVGRIGITAGASTPQRHIEAVQAAIEKLTD